MKTITRKKKSMEQWKYFILELQTTPQKTKSNFSELAVDENCVLLAMKSIQWLFVKCGFTSLVNKILYHFSSPCLLKV